MRFRLQKAVAAFLMAFGAAVPAAAQRKPCPTLVQSVTDKKFQAGQMWSYQTREGENGSTLTVLRVDSYGKIGTVVHVRVDGLKAHNPRGDQVTLVEHMPFTRDAMLISVERLLKSDQPLPTVEGLDRWQSDCGGVYTISVRDAVAVMEKTLNRP